MILIGLCPLSSASVWAAQAARAAGLSLSRFAHVTTSGESHTRAYLPGYCFGLGFSAVPVLRLGEGFKLPPLCRRTR